MKNRTVQELSNGIIKVKIPSQLTELWFIKVDRFENFNRPLNRLNEPLNCKWRSMTTHFGSAGRTRGSASIQFPRSSFIHYFRFRIFENFAARAHRFGRILFVCWRFQVNCVDTTLLTSGLMMKPPRQSFRPISSVRWVTWPAAIQLKRKIELNFLLSKSRPI